MRTFYLGYENAGDTELTEFKDASDAAYNSEEWVKVQAETLEEAKANYEEAFINWKRNQAH